MAQPITRGEPSPELWALYRIAYPQLLSQTSQQLLARPGWGERGSDASLQVWVSLEFILAVLEKLAHANGGLTQVAFPALSMRYLVSRGIAPARLLESLDVLAGQIRVLVPESLATSLLHAVRALQDLEWARLETARPLSRNPVLSIEPVSHLIKPAELLPERWSPYKHLAPILETVLPELRALLVYGLGAVLVEQGGARVLYQLQEGGYLHLVIETVMGDVFELTRPPLGQAQTQALRALVRALLAPDTSILAQTEGLL